MPECGCNCCTFCSLLLVFAAAAAGAIIYQDQTGNKIPFIGDNIPNTTEVLDKINDVRDKWEDFDWGDLGFDFEDVINMDDPNSTGTGELTYAWDVRGGGEVLEMTLLNALTDDWEVYFNKALVDWQVGTPNHLSLTSESVTPEEKCVPVEGTMKVCNGDYGGTGWEGINEILTRGNEIISSVAKMNEYYLGLDKLSGDRLQHKRQYTMCHEIGHGWGLPHLDENFLNKDLNSCMDYSQNPSANLVPNAQDYLNLDILYGDGVQPTTAATTVDADPAGERRTRSLRVVTRKNRWVRLGFRTEKAEFNGEVVDKHIYILPAQ